MCPQDTMPHSMLMKLKSGSKPSWAYILKVYIIIYVYDLPKTLLLTTIKQNLTYYGTDRKTDTRTRKHNALQPSQTGHKNNCIELTIPRDICDTFMSLDNYYLLQYMYYASNVISLLVLCYIHFCIILAHFLLLVGNSQFKKKKKVCHYYFHSGNYSDTLL